MFIRLANANEMVFIRSYAKKVQEEASLGYIKQTDNIPEKESYFSGHSYYLVLVHHGVLRGWILLGETINPLNYQPVGVILELYVLPAHRKHGYGMELMNYALAHFKYRQIFTVQLNVYEGNPAQKLYKKLGFREVSTLMEISFINTN
ncbi:GNAT family N-acetyltransferase [Sutcliffiella deserti]|uniref:GNAT family N-acetyltransferase n=1 Tax=Sutcliffiella deserti TaxID=2875501 RepID=UPI001CBF115A|nr:GNAT family N-acetyltransferase [Sutcliffiella deserti]